MSDKSQVHFTSQLQGERAQLSDSVRNQDERLSLLENVLSASRSGVVIMDARLNDMPIVYVNPYFEYITGYSASEVIGHNARFLYREDTNQPGLDELRIAVSEQRSCTVVLRNYRKDGAVFWNELSLSPTFNDAGMLTYYVGLQYDVTERNVGELSGELTRIKDRAEAILNSSTNGIILAHRQKGIEQTNQAFNDMFACQPDDYFRHPLVSLALPGDVPLLERAFQAAITGEEVQLVEIHALRKDQTVFSAEFGISVIASKDPDFQHIVCTIHDISERKLAEEALRESEERFRLLTEAAPVAIVIADDQGQIVLVNIETEVMFGYSRNDMIGQPVEMLMPAASRNTHVQLRHQYYANPHSRSTGIGMELSAERKDGTQFPVEIGLRSIELPSGILVMSFIIDISERRKAQEALQATKDQLQAIMDNSSAAIFVKDIQGHYIVANRRFCDMLGLPDTAIEGSQDSDLFDPQRVDPMRAADEQVLTKNHSVEVEDRIKRRNEYYTILTVKFPLRDPNGQPYAIGGIVTDITQRKQVEIELRQALKNQQELNDLKTRFVSMASHEFRTPLATILATTDTLHAYRKQMEDPDIDRRLEKIRHQIDHLKNIIEDVLQLSRFQTSHMAFAPVEMDFDEFCRDILDEFRSRPDISHQFEYSTTTSPLLVSVDKKLMRQTLSNLIQNAIKYSPSGTTVHLNIAYEDNRVLVQVRDEGIGIPEADIKHLFEAFHRATNVGTVPGTGLGLAIAKESIDLHNGTIFLESQIGKGTTVNITIPVKPLERLEGHV